MVEPQPSKLMMWVRFPSPAPINGRNMSYLSSTSPHSSGAEHFLGKEEVPGSIPGVGSKKKIFFYLNSKIGINNIKLKRVKNV
tara:strand:- start:17669 stop:17917 length:249 start_codon:yes stop_codon:yes gene_type:complete